MDQFCEGNGAKGKLQQNMAGGNLTLENTGLAKT